MPAFLGRRQGLAQDSIQPTIQPPPIQPPRQPCPMPPHTARRQPFVQNFIDGNGRRFGHQIALKMQAQNFLMLKTAKDKKKWYEDNLPSWFIHLVK